MLNPAHLRALEAVVRAGSFTGAALELGYTASAVSQQIAALERDSRCVLFERHAHSITPTSVALTLADQASGALAVLDELEDDVRSIAGGTVGRLRIGSFPTASERLIPAALVEVSRALPRVDVELEEGEPEDLLPQVLNRRIDLAFVYEYNLVPRSWPRALQRRKVLDDNVVILVPSATAPTGEEVHLPGLKDAAWVSTAVGTSGAECLVRLCAASGFVPNVKFRTNDYDVVTELVAAGLGVAMAPVLAWRADPRIRRILLAGTDSPPTRQVYVVTRKVGANPAAQVALDPILASLARSQASRGTEG